MPAAGMEASEVWSIGSIDPMVEELNPIRSAESRWLQACFYIAGFATLLGWQIILSFTHSFDCTLFRGKRFAGAGWAFWCSMGYSLTVNITQLVLTSRTVVSRVPFALRWNVAAVCSALSLIGLMLCHLYTTPDSLEMGFALAVACVSLTGAASGIWQACAFGLAGCLAPSYAQAVMFGQGLSGVFSSIVGAAVSSSRLGLIFSFTFAAVFELLGIPVLYAMNRNPIVQEAGALKPATVENQVTPSSSPVLARARSSREILVQNAWPQALTVAAVFTVSFTVFPGVTSRLSPGSRVPLLISLFQTMDFLGRFAPRCSVLRIDEGPVVSGLAALRILFVPLFIAMQRQSGQTWAHNGVLQVAVMVAFAFSNGYVSTLSMMLGPAQRGVSADEREPVGTMMSLALVFGIWLGSLLGIVTQVGMQEVNTC